MPARRRPRRTSIIDTFLLRHTHKHTVANVQTDKHFVRNVFESSMSEASKTLEELDSFSPRKWAACARACLCVVCLGEEEDEEGKKSTTTAAINRKQYLPDMQTDRKREEREKCSTTTITSAAEAKERNEYEGVVSRRNIASARVVLHQRLKFSFLLSTWSTSGDAAKSAWVTRLFLSFV